MKMSTCYLIGRKVLLTTMKDTLGHGIHRPAFHIIEVAVGLTEAHRMRVKTSTSKRPLQLVVAIINDGIGAKQCWLRRRELLQLGAQKMPAVVLRFCNYH